MSKKIAIIIAFKDFRDEECFIPRSIFVGEGFNVKIASAEKGKALGSYGGLVDVDLQLSEIKVDDFEAIVFVGGSGASQYLDNEKAHQIAEQAIAQGKVLAAICIAPAILANAGVLNGKKATVWSSPMDKSLIKTLKAEGVDYQNQAVVIDDKIITANGPQAARKFAEAIVRALN